MKTGIRATDLDTAQSLTKMLRNNKSLTHLDLSYNSFLKSRACCIFKGLQHNTTLTHLSLSNTSLATSNIDTARRLNKMLQVNKSLTHLDLSGNDTISDSGACCIFEGLQYNTNLTHLNLRKTGVRAKYLDTARSLTKMLLMNKSLTHLDVSCDSFLKSRACRIFKGLQHNTTLTHLSLRNTSLATSNIDTARCLTKMLQVNKSLIHLDLSENNTIADQGACCIFKGLQHNTTLTHLSLRNTSLANSNIDTARCLTKMLQVNKSLIHLDLSENNTIADQGACCIFKGLQHNTTLTHLSLRNTSLATSNIDTARCLTKMLQVNKSLTHLDLSGNNTITDSGACYIFEGLQHNTSLIYLDLSNTNITATDPNTARSLATMLKVNKCLVHLDLSYTHISSSNIGCIFEGLQQNSALAELILLHKEIEIFAMDSETAIRLSKILQVNKTLRYLDLSNSVSAESCCVFDHDNEQLHLNLRGVTINDSDVECITEGLKSNVLLKSLKVDGGKGFELVLELLKTNPRLKTIYIYTTEASEKAMLDDSNAARQEKGLPLVEIVLVKRIPYQADNNITTFDDSDDDLDYYNW